MAEARTRHVPLRRCVLCRASAPRAGLIRLVWASDGYRLDLARRLGGRGIWVCPVCAADPDERRLRRAFKGHAPQVRLLLQQAAASHASPARQATTGSPAPEA